MAVVDFSVFDFAERDLRIVVDCETHLALLNPPDAERLLQCVQPLQPERSNRPLDRLSTDIAGTYSGTVAAGVSGLFG